MSIDLQAWGFLPLSFFIAFVSIPVLIKIAHEKNLFDAPDFERKLHTRVTPTMGGVAIFLAFTLSFGISGYADSISGYAYLFTGLTLLFFTGFKDDIMEVSPRFKLIAQISAGLLMIYGAGSSITTFGGVFGIHTLPAWAVPVITLFTLIVVINSYNLIDGIDGLAGGIGIIASGFFGAGFILAGEPALGVLSFFLVAALFGFLIHNFNPASIFMGDTGSLIVGFLLGYLAVNFVGLSENSLFFNFFGTASPVLAIAVLSLPLYDTMRVFCRRIYMKRSPFNPGKDHVHHVLLGMGFSHGQTSFILYVGTTILTVSVGLLSFLDVNILLLSTVAGMFLVYPTNGLKRLIFAKVFGMPGQRVLRRIKWANDPASALIRKGYIPGKPSFKREKSTILN